jgi:hypothetical protein
MRVDETQEHREAVRCCWRLRRAGCGRRHRTLTGEVFLRTTPGAIASGGFAGTARAATATASSDGSAVLDPTKWPLDQSQWTQYRARRAVIFDTRAQSFLPANPERLLAAALRKRSEQTEAAASASAGYTSTHGGGSGGDAR